ncbi:uncharacterized protein LOC122651179 [Telopea speciosissima]|uniref:uncharacterized protein LOC122651179 n=1 Tax=Telopea speciosissima TaxID=54955 RepID=UPI001CC6E055|nr:uncharacterized protein LOC122651179 [Telopea speciosissima]
MADTKNSTDNVNIQITSIKLKGSSNYLLWAQADRVYIMVKDKLSCIISDPPAPDSKDYSTWMKENAIILIWRHNSITRIYELYEKLFQFQQYDKSLQEYYSAFKGIVEELNVFQPLTTDIEKLKAQRDEFFVSKFLAGLYPNLKVVKGHLLADTNPKENSAFTTSRGCGLRGGRGTGGRGSGGQHIDKAARQCSYCEKSNHIVDTCLSKQGKPEWTQHLANHAAPEESTNMVASSDTKSGSAMAESSTALRDEVHQLMRCIKSLESSTSTIEASTSTATLAHAGTHAFLSTTSTPWIIDSGASAHITDKSSIFSSISSNSHTPPVILANGSYTPVTGHGTDLHKRKTTGGGHEKDGLYYLYDAVPCASAAASLQLLLVESRHSNGIVGDKLDPRSTKCVFLGNSRTQKGYRCYDPITRRQFVSVDVTFFEGTSYFSDQPTLSDDPLTVSDPPPIPVVVPLSNPPLQVYRRKGHIGQHSTNTTGPSQSLLVPSLTSGADPPLLALPDLPTEPNDLLIAVRKALSIPAWKKAMDVEMDALLTRHTWELVELPLGKDLVKCRWVYTIKYHSDGSVERLKARPCFSNHSVFVCCKGEKLVVLVVYVDDIIVSGNDEGGIKEVKDYLQQHFQTKDLGQLHYFLGIEVIRSKKGISLSQRKYVLDLLTDSGMLAAKPLDIPMDPDKKFGNDDGQPLKEVHSYRSLIGKLIYLSVTRPDISFVVRVLSQFMQSPCKSHWDAAIRVLRYLKGAPGKGLIYRPKRHMELVAYSNADWAGSASDRRSTTGYCTFVGGNLVM